MISFNFTIKFFKFCFLLSKEYPFPKSPKVQGKAPMSKQS